jgi:hypothetical protein
METRDRLLSLVQASRQQNNRNEDQRRGAARSHFHVVASATMPHSPQPQYGKTPSPWSSSLSGYPLSFPLNISKATLSDWGRDELIDKDRLHLSRCRSEVAYSGGYSAPCIMIIIIMMMMMVCAGAMTMTGQKGIEAFRHSGSLRFMTSQIECH